MFETYREAFRKELGAIPLKELTRADVARARDRLAATPVTWGQQQTTTSKPRAAGTVNRYLAAFSRVLALASDEWQWTPENPVRRLSRLREPRGRERFLTADEVKAPVSYTHLTLPTN